MSETKVENVKDFLDKLTKIQKNKEDTELFFRGHADQAYEAEPTIFRKNRNGERNLLKNEMHLFNDMITQCPEDFKDYQYTFEYLVKMQHYGLPTRLLDITSNALVALYFACCSLNSKNSYEDGQVLVYVVRKDAIKNYNSDTVSVLSNLVQLDSNFELFTKDKEKRLEQLQSQQKNLDNELVELQMELRIINTELITLQVKFKSNQEVILSKAKNKSQEEIKLLNEKVKQIIQDEQLKKE